MKKKFTLHYVRALSKLLCSLLFILSFSVAAYCQTVSGTVTNADNQPVSGVTVQVKNTDRATATNDAGKFQINASANSVLVFTSVGFTKQEVPVNGRNSLSITLIASAQGLDEVVV